MNRRQFSLFAAAGIVGLPRLLRAQAVSETPLAELLPVDLSPAPASEVLLEHWRAAENASLRWFEKSQLISGEWLLVAQTLPIRRTTGEMITDDAFDPGHCVDLSEVPEPLRLAQQDKSGQSAMTDFCVARRDVKPGPAPVAGRKHRHGRPPSHWLRTLDRDQLRYWLSSFEPPEAGVSGMTYLEHLVDGHSFDLSRVEGLTIAEQAKLHGAAHGGY